MMTTPFFDPTLLRGTSIDLDRHNEALDLPGTSVQTTKQGWSSVICAEKALLRKIPSDIKAATNQRNIVINFFTFYATGKVDNKFSELDVILAAAHLIFPDGSRNATDLIWPDNYYSDDPGFCGFTVVGETITELTPGDSTTLATIAPAAAIVVDDDVRDIDAGLNIVYETEEERARRLETPDASRPEENILTLAELVKSHLHKYSSGSLKEFIKECNAILARSPASRGVTPGIIQLYRLANMLAITMLRAVTKTTAQMFTAFLKESLMNNIKSLIPGPASTKYAPPSKQCLERVGDTIRKGNISVSSTFAKLVILKSKDDVPPEIVSMLGAAVLTHTAWNGMGIMNMLFEIGKHYTIGWKQILRMTLFNQTLSSWNMINKFCMDYEKTTGSDQTVPWARVIDDGYFTGMNCGAHHVLASILLEPIAEMQGGRGIEGAQWATKYKTSVEYYKPASKWLRDELEGRNTTLVAALTTALPIAKIMAAQRSGRTVERDSTEGEIDPIDDSDV